MGFRIIISVIVQYFVYLIIFEFVCIIDDWIKNY